MSTSKNEFTQQSLLERVNSVKMAEGNPRARAIVARIVSDLFKTIDELDVSPDEFWAAADWLSRLGASGQIGLITPGLGFDRLLDIPMDEADATAAMARATRGAWHANKSGGSSHFFPGLKEFELRRKIETDAQGNYRFRTTLPPGYAIPPNSPTSELFEVLGRHGHRPAHIHFHIVKEGHRTLTTQINIPGDTYIDDAFAFATRDGLVLKIEHDVAPAGYESLRLGPPLDP